MDTKTEAGPICSPVLVRKLVKTAFLVLVWVCIVSTLVHYIVLGIPNL